MNIRHLLQQRATLLRQSHLANLAFAYDRLGAWGRQIAQARLRGLVTLRLADAAAERPWPDLIAQEGSQSVIAEHFLDEDVVELADVLAFIREEPGQTSFTFRLEELEAEFCPNLRRELAAAGVVVGIDPAAHRPAPRPSGEVNTARDDAE